MSMLDAEDRMALVIGAVVMCDSCQEPVPRDEAMRLLDDPPCDGAGGYRYVEPPRWGCEVCTERHWCECD